MSRELFELHLPIARSIAEVFARRVPASIDPSDLLSAAMVGLWEAASRNPGHENFIGYAKTRISGAVIDELRRQNWTSRGMLQRRDLVNLVLIDEFKDLDNYAGYSTPSIAERVVETAEMLERLKELPKRTQRLVRMLLCGERQVDIARKLGLSEPRIYQLLTEVRARMRGCA
jgi:RNA polymerase sigma factor (sigma-70 family)